MASHGVRSTEACVVPPVVVDLWLQDVRNPDGTPISREKPEEASSGLVKSRRMPACSCS